MRPRPSRRPVNPARRFSSGLRISAVLLDVREESEFNGDLGHIREARLIPLKELPARAEEVGARNREIVTICRAGMRSTTAAAILTGLGFEHVSNLKGGMLAWDDQRLPVER